VYRLERHVGRLVELDFGPITLSEEHLEIGARLTALSLELGQRLVIAADHRRAVHIPVALGVNIGKGMRAANHHIERSAILLARELPAEQLRRIVKETDHPARHVFQSVAEMKAWLCETLDPAERARLDAFLY
jgi:hypothetical protein